jgi:hypothetical protein
MASCDSASAIASDISPAYCDGNSAAFSRRANLRVSNGTAILPFPEPGGSALDRDKPTVGEI